METVYKEYEDLSKHYKQGKFRTCKVKIKELLERNLILLDSAEDINIYSWIMRNNDLICEYLDNHWYRDHTMVKCMSVQCGFYSIIKECLYKNNSNIEMDLILINNILQCCCSEEKCNIYDNICCVIIALKKVLSTYHGIDFKPPSTLKIDNPSCETVALIRDIMKSLPNFDPTCRLLLCSSLVLILQVLLISNGGQLPKTLPQSSCKGWETLALENLSFLMPDIIQFLEIQEKCPGSKFIDVWTRKAKFKSSETDKMETDIDVSTIVREKHSVQNVLKNIPIFTCDLFGDIVILHDIREPYSMGVGITHCLLLITSIISQLFGYLSMDMEIPFLEDGSTWSVSHVVNAWKYFKGYLHYNNGKLKEAMELMEVLDFSSFSSHFRNKKALLTANILSKQSKHMMALAILNKEAWDCQDCLPIILYTISEEYRYLGHKESELEALRLLLKVLKHRSYLENLSKSNPKIFSKTLDIIHPLPEVTMAKALEKLASRLAHNELYEESAECYLDLLALLEKTGPAKTFRHVIHNAAAALLLICDNTGLTRTKDAASLCKRAITILHQNSFSPLNMSSFSSPDSFENGPSASKMSKLESNVGEIFMELESAINSEEKFEKMDDFNYDIEQVDDIEMEIFENDQDSKSHIGKIYQNSIYTSLFSSGKDLMSSILLSECAFRENDFQRSLHLLNRCLQNLSHHEVLKRSKMNSRENFFKTTDFIVSHIWLRKAKILIKRELIDNCEFAKDIEHCFRNALIRNPDNADVKYNYMNYMLASGKMGVLNVKKPLPISQVNSLTFLNMSPTSNLALWYIFRPTVTKDQYENLTKQIKELQSSSESHILYNK